MTPTDITTSEVLQAIAEFDRLGRETFLRTHRFGRARCYLLSHNGNLYDSKAIVGVAHGYLPGRAPLTAKDFSGGKDHAAGLLRDLGFTVLDGPAVPGTYEKELLGRIAGMKVTRAAGSPALDQPIALLWAAGRARRGESRLLPWGETGKAVRGLLERHGTPGEPSEPDYPVSALYHAGLWTLQDHTGTVPTAHGDSALRRWFADNQPRGGLTEPAYDALRQSGQVRIAVIDALLRRYFDGLDHTPLLRDVGLYDNETADDPVGSRPPDPVTAAAQYDRLCRIVEHWEDGNRGRTTVRLSYDPVRSGSARRAVLLRCEGHCENPGCTGQPSDVTAAGTPILEVDHVMDLALGGRDHPSQMVALCPNCHATKTRGSTGETLRAILLAVATERHTRPHRVDGSWGPHSWSGPPVQPRRTPPARRTTGG